MLRNLKLEKYRSFDEYELNNLSRVNLLVGKNDCGKTSILEAIHFLVSRGDPMVLAECAGRRGEGTDVAPRSAAPPLAELGSGSRPVGPSIARFFFGHRFAPGATCGCRARGTDALQLGSVSLTKPTMRILRHSGC